MSKTVKITMVNGEPYTSQRLCEEVPTIDAELAASRLRRFEKGLISAGNLFRPYYKRVIVARGEKYDAKKLRQKIPGLSSFTASCRIAKFSKSQISVDELFMPVKFSAMIDGIEYTPVTLCQKIAGLKPRAAKDRIKKFLLGKIDKEKLLEPYNKKCAPSRENSEFYNEDEMEMQRRRKVLREVAAEGRKAHAQRERLIAAGRYGESGEMVCSINA